MASFEELMRKNIDIMNELDGFGVVIICCSSVKQAEYWQGRLESAKGSIVAKGSVVLAVDEDWPGGAGNALGTLYAFKKAAEIAKRDFGRDLLNELQTGTISVGLYHTAGKGTRLAPLPASENNNKPGVKLPATVTVGNRNAPITILEAVIKQTGCYAKSRLGRLSVFWGDQVFIPTAPVEYAVAHHIDILCSLGPMPSEAEWKAKGMDKYGLIAQSAHGAAQVEKVDHATAVDLLKSIGEIQSVGASLGSFSISSQMLTALLEEFAVDLERKTGKLDSDPHLWMPMTLEKAAYLQLMQQKGINVDQSSSHFDRIEKMMNKFNENYKSVSLGLFGPVDVGQGVYWWDYGQLKLYQRNTQMMVERSNEADLMRLFLGISNSELVKDSSIQNTDVDENSCISSCELGTASGAKGHIRNCALSNVRCRYIEAENAVLINVTADRIIAKGGSIIYNVIGDSTTHGSSDIILNEKEVLVGVFDDSGEHFRMRSHLETDGGKAWEVLMHDNAHTFDGVHKVNANACPTTIEKAITLSHDTAWKSL